MSLPALAERTEPFLHSSFKRIFELSRQLKNPINLGIGAPHFDVPDPIKEVAIKAIREGHNSYSLPSGIPELRQSIKRSLNQRFGLSPDASNKDAFITCGTNGALTLALQSMLNSGDEIIIFDPYFVVYPQLTSLVGGRPVLLETYPDFQPDPERVAAAITPRTKAILLCSPGNPTGVVTQPERVRALAKLADQRGVLLISDEIYSTFVYDDSFTSPAQFADNVLICSSFSKTHAMPGWRLGYAYGPAHLIQAMIAIQQSTFVCAPSMAQVAGVAAWDFPMKEYVADYQHKRDWCLAHLDPRYQVVVPEGAFYLFPKTPWGTGTEFAEAAVKHGLVIMPGMVFSRRDTHFRLSYGVDERILERGVEILNQITSRSAA
jgi:aspartate aminotransferase/aminotransferase